MPASLRKIRVSHDTLKEVMATLIKWVLVLVLMAGGALFLAQGIGIHTLLAKHEESGGWVRDLVVGLGSLVLGTLMAAFWKIQAGGGASDLDEDSPRSRKVIKVERYYTGPK